MVLIVVFASVPLRGGRLSALTELRLKGVPVVAGAFAVQVLIVNVFPHGSRSLHELINVLTYAVLGVVMAANLQVPGMAFIAAGGALHTAAIAANGRGLPRPAGGARFAGLPAD